MKGAATYDEYLALIKSIKDQDRKSWFNQTEAKLTQGEEKLNAYMKKKRDELIGNRKYIYDAYSPSLKFHYAKNDIMYNALFEIFKRMPQGGNLHIHTGATWDNDKFTKMLADVPNVYVYWDPDAGLKPLYPNGKLYYLKKAPTNPNFYNYSKIAKSNYPVFMHSKKMLTFIDPRIDDIEYIWDGFNDYFIAVSSVLKVKDVYKKYYVAAFKHQYEHGNDYIEIRTGVPDLVDSNDAEITATEPSKSAYTAEPPEALTLLKAAYREAKNSGCPDLKVKAIVAPSRRTSKDPDSDITEAMAILKCIPEWQSKLKDDDGTEFIIGFDVVSEEDINHRTQDYAKKIIDMRSPVNFYFHDGERNWVDNDNIHSAWALGTQRIGHGINLYNFPTLLGKIRDEKIRLEICPVSNQILRYTKDLRIHPIAQFMQQGVKCVICSDDPQIFETAGIYYDLWEVYHGAMIDLSDVKELIKNSYTYSGMTAVEKSQKLADWEKKWEKYINEIQPLISL